MRFFAAIVLLVTVAMVSAIPITPTAWDNQHLAERMRSEGIAENEIAQQLSRPLEEHFVEHVEQPKPFLTRLSAQFQSIFRSEPQVDKTDLYGDIAPGSLEAPEMLPRAAAPESFVDTMNAMLRREDSGRREFGYEGKESEMRRPEGMRHWNS